MNSKAGNLYIVATPIGNLADISYRAVETLKSVDKILVEDSRHARTLLDHYQVRTPLKSYHEHNEVQMIPKVLAALSEGQSFALISDAGTPLVSDPGFKLVREAQLVGYQPLVVPGPCAAIAALSVSGLPTDRFVFEGFLPAKTAAREAHLESLQDEIRTLVFYEGKHRIAACLQSIAKVLGAQRRAVVARELTKKFETVLNGLLSDLVSLIETQPDNSKGEFVILVEGQQQKASSADLERLLGLLMRELSVKKASQLAANISGAGKNECYELALKIQQDAEEVAS